MKRNAIGSMVCAGLAACWLTGCGSSLTHLQVKDNLEAWREDPEAKHATEPASGIAPAPDGVELVGTTDIALKGFGLLTSDESEPILFRDEQSEKDFKVGTILLTGGEAAREIIEWHLAKVWPAVKVSLVPDAAPSSGVVIRVSRLGILMTDGVSFGVTLEATLPNGRKLTATAAPKGVHTGGNWGWILPVAIITGVAPAFFWVRPTITGIEQGAEEKKYIEALDVAASDLALQLANQSAWGESEKTAGDSPPTRSSRR
jgi:hypothetical protein